MMRAIRRVLLPAWVAAAAGLVGAADNTAPPATPPAQPPPASEAPRPAAPGASQREAGADVDEDAEDLAPGEKGSADNNVSFPVDI